MPAGIAAHAVLGAMLVIVGFADPFVLGYADMLWQAAYTPGATVVGLALKAITMRQHFAIGLFSAGPTGSL